VHYFIGTEITLFDYVLFILLQYDINVMTMHTRICTHVYLLHRWLSKRNLFHACTYYMDFDVVVISFSVDARLYFDGHDPWFTDNLQIYQDTFHLAVCHFVSFVEEARPASEVAFTFVHSFIIESTSSYPDIIFLFSGNVRIKRTGRYELVSSAVKPRRAHFSR